MADNWRIRTSVDEAPSYRLQDSLNLLHTSYSPNKATCSTMGERIADEPIAQMIGIPVEVIPRPTAGDEGLMLADDIPLTSDSQTLDTTNLPVGLNSTPSEEVRGAIVRSQKIPIKRGGSHHLSKSQARKQFPARPPQLRVEDVQRDKSQDTQGDVEDRNKAGGALRKRKAWLPPGIGDSGTGGPYGRPS